MRVLGFVSVVIVIPFFSSAHSFPIYLLLYHKPERVRTSLIQFLFAFVSVIFSNHLDWPPSVHSLLGKSIKIKQIPFLSVSPVITRDLPNSWFLNFCGNHEFGGSSRTIISKRGKKKGAANRARKHWCPEAWGGGKGRERGKIFVAVCGRPP